MSLAVRNVLVVDDDERILAMYKRSFDERVASPLCLERSRCAGAGARRSRSMPRYSICTSDLRRRFR